MIGNAVNDTTGSVGKGIPMPVVKLNRWIMITGVLIGLLLQKPLFTTVLFLVIFPAALFGQKWSLIGKIGRRLFPRHTLGDEWEDPRLMRFNNTVAAVLLGLSQVAFLLNVSVVGWALSLMVAAAAAVALAGFCLGCFLYYQFRINRYRIFGK